MTEVDLGAVTLARPVNVLKPGKVSLKVLSDGIDTRRHSAVVVSNKDEPQGVAWRENWLLAHRSRSTILGAAAPTCFQLELISALADCTSRRVSSQAAKSQMR